MIHVYRREGWERGREKSRAFHYVEPGFFLQKVKMQMTTH